LFFYVVYFLNSVALCSFSADIRNPHLECLLNSTIAMVNVQESGAKELHWA